MVLTHFLKVNAETELMNVAQTHGNHLVVTTYYAVTRDGVICVPWNWKDGHED